MRQLSLLLLLFFLAQFRLSAQCEAMSYIIDAQGFVCGDEIGTICIQTNGDLAFPPNGCFDYVVEIEFPTGSFIFTDLQDFVIQSQDMNTTVLRAQPLFIAGIWTSNCLEGVVQIPNTVFTLRIVNMNDPADIVEMETFTIDDFVEIGTTGTTTLLSDAIATTALLDAAQASITGQRVVINGTLVVDVPYSFGVTTPGPSNDIYMGPGARIEVQSGNTLSFFRGLIRGCDAQWDQINVAPNAVLNIGRFTVADATTAVELQDLSELNLFAVGFRDNGTGIASLGPDLKTIDFTIFQSFGTGVGFRDGEIGCQFQNVDLINFNGFVGFRNLTDAIILENTSLNGFNIDVRECTNGISVLEASDFLGITESRFRDANWGIGTVGNVEMQVDNSDFEDLNFGIIRGSGVVNEHSLIEDNTINFNGTSIFGIVQPSWAEVQGNEMLANQSNVVLFGLGSGKHRWAIQNNSQLAAGIETNGSNVIFFNIDDGRVFRNDFLFAIENDNIQIIGGQRCKVGYNPQTFADEDNIFISNSPKALIYCNFFDGAQGINVLSDCAGSIFRGNEMNSTGFNLTYGSSGNTFAVTGPQFYRGNLFDDSSAEQPKARHFGSSSIALESQYRVGFSAGNQGTSLFPFFESSSTAWFEKDFGGFDYTCPPGIIQEGPQIDMLTEAIATRINLLNNSIKDSYGAELEFDIELKLYRDLSELQTYQTLDRVQQEWYVRLSTTVIGDFVAFEETYRTLTEYTETEQRQAEGLSARINELRKGLNSIVWYSFDKDKDTYVIDENQKVAYDAALAQLNTTIDDLATLNASKSDALIAAIPQLSAINSRITTTRTGSALNLKTANELLLRRIDPNFSNFTDVEIATLKSIAGQCAGIGGEGVYIARGLVAEATLTYQEYNDECLVEKAPGRDAAYSALLQLEGFALSPNPADKSLWVSLPEEHDVRQLEVRDLLGKTL
ncbi:MAG: hypothetical protein AAFP19_05770, partial [Bacteroidota bacterium]